MSQTSFETVLKKFPLGVSVVTVGRGGVENGLTVSWASPVAFEPLHIMIAVDKAHFSLDLIKSTQNFTLNVLKRGQEKLAGHFASQAFSDQPKLDAVATRQAPTGGAILTDALAYFDCEVVGLHPYGGHEIVVGKVIAAEVLSEGEPLTANDGPRYLKK